MLDRILLVPICCILALGASAQGCTKRTYLSGGSEISVSAPMLDVNGSDHGGRICFAPVISVQQTVNKDLSNRSGLFFGHSVNNVGFIYDHPDSSNYRTYALGLPIGFKVGTMDGGLFFAGYSVEWAFNYKEKQFVNEDKLVVWVSDRVNPFSKA